jgi:succinate dehydrogenase/fumarate reductase flavoprotein subunit
MRATVVGGGIAGLVASIASTEACDQSERRCGDAYDRSVPLLAAVYTMITERVPSQ